VWRLRSTCARRGRPAAVRRSERSDKIIWERVRRVAAKTGVRAHVHALRAAFAVQFIDMTPAKRLPSKT
jgi:hypothetical protein